MTDLKTTPLHALHLELGARMVPFAGYDMPVQYAPGVMKEHLQCRATAGLFDVSHMGQVILTHADGAQAAALALERLVPADVAGLAAGRQRYGLFTDDAGGILDDLMFARRADDLLLVVNAACKQADIAHLTAGLPDCVVTPVTDRALVALQGPAAEQALDALVPGVAAMRFMDQRAFPSNWGELWVSRSGYTGEDGYEISVATDQAEALARAMLDRPEVDPIGLGARDSLRLEAGMCLYGSDIDTATNPVEADLVWAIGKARRSGGARQGGFPGADRVLDAIKTGAARRRVGILPDGRGPMRAGTPLFAGAEDSAPIGAITSGAFGPSVGAPVSMGYVATASAAAGTTIYGEVRGKRLPAVVSPLPFHKPTYKR